ncbi:hypothetical protein A2U01_0084097, partial [Trifolium medium]|nr:hypothetical protein [Trifolium medium]
VGTSLNRPWNPQEQGLVAQRACKASVAFSFAEARNSQIHVAFCRFFSLE